MNFKIKKDEKFSRRLKWMGRKQIRDIQKHLKVKPGCDPLAAIHEARRGIKKYRALIRLIRRRLDDELYRRENAILRDLGRSLSTYRDTEALQNTLQKLQAQHPEHLSDRQLSRWKNGWLKKQKTRPGNPASLKASSALRLQSLLKDIRDWPVKDFSKNDFRFGIKHTHHRYARAYKMAREAATTPQLHAWRKRTKDLSHQLAIIEPISPRSWGKIAAPLGDLAGILGADHDLALLESKTERLSLPPALERLITTQRQELQQSAFKLGRKLHRTMPDLIKMWTKKV
jgi:CHAD domain-containing protein